MPTIWRRQQIEDLALITLLDFRRQTGLPLTPPIDVDLVGEIMCDLRWDWDILVEPPGTLIWAGLFPHERRVVLNETHKDKFTAKSGLERFTKGHEIGHWILHVADERNGRVIEGEKGRNGDYLNCASAASPPLSSSLLCNGPVNWQEKQADWFAGALLMPANVFVPIAERYDLFQWKSLYELARLFDVTISALCVRLAQLDLSYVDEHGKIHAAKVNSHQPGVWRG